MAGEEAPPRAAPPPADGGKPPGVPEAPHEGAPPTDVEQQVPEQPEAVDTTTAGHGDEVSDWRIPRLGPRSPRGPSRFVRPLPAAGAPSRRSGPTGPPASGCGRPRPPAHQPQAPRHQCAWTWWRSGIPRQAAASESMASSPVCATKTTSACGAAASAARVPAVRGGRTYRSCAA